MYKFNDYFLRIHDNGTFYIDRIPISSASTPSSNIPSSMSCLPEPIGNSDQSLPSRIQKSLNKENCGFHLPIMCS